tara:strand:+ start:240 stop:380 length:141 start_codon:yes stop_codon:yes gene_type:complete
MNLAGLIGVDHNDKDAGCMGLFAQAGHLMPSMQACDVRESLALCLS